MGILNVKIMRGVSGSGKSTWIKEDVAHHPRDSYVILSADSIIVEQVGSYVWNPKNSKAAHKECYRRFLNLITRSNNTLAIDTVYVDNTNTRAQEIAPYYRAAEAFGHDVQVVSIYTNPALALSRNVHGSPKWVVDSQQDRLQSGFLPRDWEHIIIKNSSERDHT